MVFSVISILSYGCSYNKDQVGCLDIVEHKRLLLSKNFSVKHYSSM